MASTEEEAGSVTRGLKGFAWRTLHTGYDRSTLLVASRTSAEVSRATIDSNLVWRRPGSANSLATPGSVNTVLEDIRSGMAAERLERYAQFFKVPAALFLDEAIGAYAPEFSCQILKSRHDARVVSPFDCGRGVANLELLNRQNDEVNLNDLLGLLGVDQRLQGRPAVALGLQGELKQDLLSLQ